MKHFSQLTEKPAYKDLRTGRLALAWVVSALLFLTFDLLWCSITTFRSMSFVQTYIFALLGATVISLPAALVPRRSWIQLALWIAVTGVMIANMMYFRTYFTAIPAASYLMVSNLSDFKGSVADSLVFADIILPLWCLTGYILLRRRRAGDSHPLAWVSLTAALSLAGWLASLPYGGPAEHIHTLSQQCYYANCPPAIYTPAGPVAAELAATREQLSDSEAREVAEWLSEHRRRLSPPLSIDRAKSLVIIFLESFESWAVGAEIEGRKVTPYIDSLIADTTTTYIPDIVTQVGAGRSIDAQLLMLAGMLPMERDVAAMCRPDNSYYTLPKAMKEGGADRAYLLTGDKAGVWNQARVARSFGIDTLLDVNAWEMTEKIGNPAKLADAALFSQAADKMRRGEIFPVGERAYVHIVGYSGHNPWKIPAENAGLRLAGSYPGKYADYLTAVNYVDNALRPLVDYLRSRPDADDIVIAITGDHEGLAYYRRAMADDGSVPVAVDRSEHTPLIILNSPRPGRIDTEIGQADVYTSLLDIMGLEAYPWRGMGFSVFDPGHPREAVGRDGSGSDDQHLRKARHISDIILRHNLMDKAISNQDADKMAEKK